MDILTSIETAALERITGLVPGLQAADVQQSSKGLLRDMSIAVACLAGSFTPVAKSVRMNITISVWLRFKNMKGESARRGGINPVIVTALGALLNQRLNLDITAIKPQRFADVTTEETYQDGAIEYLLEFGTSCMLSTLTDEDLGDLVTIAVDYYLQPDDGQIDAQDILTTREES